MSSNITGVKRLDSRGRCSTLTDLGKRFWKSNITGVERPDSRGRCGKLIIVAKGGGLSNLTGVRRPDSRGRCGRLIVLGNGGVSNYSIRKEKLGHCLSFESACSGSAGNFSREKNMR